jgi:hypothetical protein
MLPIPAIFVVGRDGIVSARFIDPDRRARSRALTLTNNKAESPGLNRPGLPSGPRCYRAFGSPAPSPVVALKRPHLAAMVVVKSAGEMSTPKRSHQMITLW